jgi:uncharacterized protein
MNAPMNPHCHVIVMAKAPLAGYAKTRLIPALGAPGAAALAMRLLVHALAQAQQAGLGSVELCCAPSARDPAFAPWAGATGITLTDQGEGDLGERMERALQRGLLAQRRVLLIGTDAPALGAGVLRAAAAALDEHEVVFVPAFDGGYVLIGLRRPVPALFEGMTWSTPLVMQHSRERLAQAGIGHAELAPLADIDVPADLVHLPAGWL